MKRKPWLVLGLVLVAAGASPPLKIDSKPYDALGLMAVQQQGRRKPLDTLAREAVKQIHGYSAIKQLGPGGKTVATWPAVSAIVDWSARPDFWNDQDIILVRYLPLKHALLDSAARDRLKAVAAHASTPATAKSALETSATVPEISVSDLTRAAALPGLSPESKESLLHMARKLSADQIWLAPNDIEEAVVTIDGKKLSFGEWFQSVLAKNRTISMSQMSGRLKHSAPVARLTPLEDKLLETGQKLVQYKALRDRNGRALEGLDIDVTPRPTNAAYVAFTRSALLKAPRQVIEIFPQKQIDKETMDALRSAHATEPSDFEVNVLDVFEKFIDARKPQERFVPGSDKKADGDYLAWIKENAAWVPLRFILDEDLKTLEAAGFDRAKVESFRTAYRALQESEKADPGHASLEKAQALVAAARSLGTAASGQYPSESMLRLESHYNHAAPFYWSPVPYGLALVLFLFCIGMSDGGIPESSLGRGLYVAAMVALVTGILVEVYGFTLRVLISGWAPVTNMYETVIWVALVAAVLGLILELIYRKCFAALAASGASLLATLLAASVSEHLLDPKIKSLTPVLRSNYWLTIHVLTIVSSYAAFAVALMLALVAVGYYLTATYRRSARFSELVTPLGPGLLLLIPGALGVYASVSQTGPAWLSGDFAYYVVSALAGLGGMLSIMGIFAVIGEAANRDPARLRAVGLAALAVGVIGCVISYATQGMTVLFNGSLVLGGLGAIVATLSVFAQSCQIAAIPTLATEDLESASATRRGTAAAPAYASAGAVSPQESGGGVATLTRPTTTESKRPPSAPKIDERALAMRETAARIKPISNFVYRAMQVGVLLVAAGTMLGGWWADKSWGRFWGWDPKEVWALITLLVYLIPLHGRYAGWVNTFGLVCASVVCFGSVLMAWYGVNFVLGVGLHSYGFSEGGGQGVVLSATAAVLAVVLATTWRRGISQYRLA
jgi:ABC-type transport system involved in cytochrome c biogenesis permease subunit